MPTDDDDEMDCYDCGFVGVQILTHLVRAELFGSDYDGYSRCECCHRRHISEVEEDGMMVWWWSRTPSSPR